MQYVTTFGIEIMYIYTQEAHDMRTYCMLVSLFTPYIVNESSFEEPNVSSTLNELYYVYRR